MQRWRMLPGAAPKAGPPSSASAALAAPPTAPTASTEAFLEVTLVIDGREFSGRLAPGSVPRLEVGATCNSIMA